MAKLITGLALSGTIGDLTYKQTKYGTIVSRKTSLGGKQMKNDPRFVRSRENNAEFGYVAKLNSAIRNSLRLCWAGDVKSCHGKLQRLLMQAVKEDQFNARGRRIVLHESLALLRGFNLGSSNDLGAVLPVTVEVSAVRSKQVYRAQLRSFQARGCRDSSNNATHFRIVLAVAAVDPEGVSSQAVSVCSELIDTRGYETGPVALEVEHPEARGRAALVVMGIEFYQQVGGQYYFLHGCKDNALAVVEVYA